MGRKLFVGNLSFNTDERRLEEFFLAVGPVDTVNIVRDQMTGRARGFAFVEMQSDEDAQNAIQRLNDTSVRLTELSMISMLISWISTLRRVRKPSAPTPNKKADSDR